MPSKDSFDSLSALDIAEQMTYLDHQIFMAIKSELVSHLLLPITAALCILYKTFVKIS